MRTKDPALRDRLQRALRATPRQSSAEIAAALGVTAQSVRRLLRELPDGAVLSSGQRRSARYALRRALRGTLGDIPVFAIDDVGQARPLAPLALVQPQGTFIALQGTEWPVPTESKDGWWDGLPYPIYAVRPTGYMGRQLARAESTALGVSDDPDEWDDDDVIWVLSQRGPDVPGNLLVGGASYDTWFRSKLRDAAPNLQSTLPSLYAQLAVQAISVGGNSSSAAGEFPKFATTREVEGAQTPHVLVKFSGAAGSEAERRWGDLLVCEHLALECARLLPGISAARSRVLTHARRVFIEVERFDRVGMFGRRSLCGLDALHPAFLGTGETAWPILVRKLERLALIDAQSVAAVELLWWYGRLIANTDMHMGNLSFHVDKRLTLAPAYDMLPMHYAPVAGGEVPPRTFAPGFPQPQQRDAWIQACTAALEFWARASKDIRISEGFRTICRTNEESLRHLADRV